MLDGWVGLGADLDVLKKRKILFLPGFEPLTKISPYNRL